MKKTLVALLAAAGITLGCHEEEKPVLPLPPPPAYTDFAFTNKEAIVYQFTLAQWPDRVGISSANGDHRLHFYEAPNEQTKTIALDEYFVLADRQGTPFTHVLRYTGHDAPTKTLTFEDLGTGTRQAVYDPATNIADLIVGGSTFRAHVDPSTGRLAIDQTADGILNRKQAPIVADNNVITLEEDLKAAQ